MEVVLCCGRYRRREHAVPATRHDVMSVSVSGRHSTQSFGGARAPIYLSNYYKSQV